jgi:hypothetical protein
VRIGPPQGQSHADPGSRFGSFPVDLPHSNYVEKIPVAVRHGIDTSGIKFSAQNRIVHVLNMNLHGIYEQSLH